MPGRTGTVRLENSHSQTDVTTVPMLKGREVLLWGQILDGGGENKLARGNQCAVHLSSPVKMKCDSGILSIFH